MNKLFLLSCLLLALSGVNAGYSDVFFAGDTRPIVMESDSGDLEWFVSDGEFFSLQKFVPANNLSDEFLLDFGTDSIVVTQHGIVPGNLVPLLKAKSDVAVNFNVLLEGDATWRFWIFESNGRIIPVDVGSGALRVSLVEGDWLVVYFNANQYGIEKAQFNSLERDFVVWVDVTQFGDWVGKLGGIPSRDDCKHFMDKELSMLYCHVEQEVCLDRYVGADARNPSCSWDKIFSCQFDLCFEEMQKSKDADLLAEQERRVDAESRTEAGLSERMLELERASYADSNRSVALESQVLNIRDEVVGTLTSYGLVIVVLFVLVVGSIGGVYWYKGFLRGKNRDQRLRHGFGVSRQPLSRGLDLGASLERARIEKKLDSLSKSGGSIYGESDKGNGFFDGLADWAERVGERIWKKKEGGD